MNDPAASADVPASIPLWRCGRRTITFRHVVDVQDLVAAHPDWSREALAAALCRAWDWRRDDGTLNRALCQTLVRRLAARGLVTLPRARRVPGRHRRPLVVAEPVVPLPADAVLRDVVVRPTAASDQARWRQLMEAHHYLGWTPRIGESIEYVATIGPHWVALIGWGGAAWKTAPRDQWVGWDAALRERRLHLIANNTRFLILPQAAGRKNLASKVLGLTLQRLNADWQQRYHHPLLLVETFVDPARFSGTCYRATGWVPLGLTRGYARRETGYVAHGQPKQIFVRPLRPDARQHLAAPWPPPRPAPVGDPMPIFDVNRLPLDGAGGLMEALATVPDPRHRRGVRHPVRGLLTVAVAAVLAGARGFQAIAEFAAELAPDVLRRLGLPRGTPPSTKCFRLTLQRLDGDGFDRVLSAWLVRQQILTGHVVALDGKTLRGSATATTPAQHLLSAILPDLGVVVAQQAVSAKTNEIPCAAPLLAPLPLEGAVVTADALHTQAATARAIVVDSHADYVFTVKDNQPTLKEDIATLGLEAFPPSVLRRDQGARPDRDPRDLDQH
jgi:hypothetical protein